VRSSSAPTCENPTLHGSSDYPRLILLSLIFCAAAFLGIGAPAASAAPEAGPGWGFETNIGGNGFAGDVFETPRAPVATDSNGNIFAVVQPENRIVIFEPPIAPGQHSTSQVGNSSFVLSRNVAIDQSNDALYVDEVAAFGGSTIRRYTSNGTIPPTYSLDPTFEVPQGDSMAVDPTSHDLLVADPGAEAVRRYGSDGTLLETISTPAINPSWILALPDGSFYVAPTSGPDLTHFSGSGTLLGTIAEVGELHGLSFDPARSLVVASVSAGLVSYSPAGARLSVSQVDTSKSLGAAISPLGTLYEHIGPSVNVYAPGTVPGVEPPSLSGVTPTGVHAETEVDPGEEGGAVPGGSAVHFEYRIVGTTAWTSSPDQPVNQAGSFEADITGLDSNAEYEIRAVASNSIITHASGTASVSTPLGPPGLETRPATEVTETSAVLRGAINPFGLQTSYHFEFGLTTAYGSRIPLASEANGGAGHLPRSVEKTIRNLAPGTTYHFRLVATNSAGTAAGADRTFTTAPAGGITVRAYEQTTPVNKEGAAIIPRVGLQASADGNGIVFVKKAGSHASTIIVRGLAVRGAEDWTGNIDLDPPINGGTGGLLVHPTLGISEDFTHTIVASNRALTPGAVEDGGNLYRADSSSGTYELIAATSEPNAFVSFAYSSHTGLVRAGAPDYSWLVFGSEVSLLPGVPPHAMYRWSDTDGLEVISVTPNGEAPRSPHAFTPAEFNNVSADGSRIYFDAAGGSEEGVFLRENGGPAKAISVSHISSDPTPQPAVLFGVNKDGRYAFFGSTAKLTDDASGGLDPFQEVNLYRYDADDGSLEYTGALAYPGYPSLGISDDGDTIYFDRGPGLGPLTVWRDGVIHTVAPEGLRQGSERYSPDGRYYVVSRTVAGTPNVIQLYDAETNELICVSCLPDGTAVSADLPANTEGDVLFSNRNPRVVSNNGTVYFDTDARLVAADVNGSHDVYEYHDGAVTLISPGNRPFDAIIGDVSADGKNVFFTTQQKLVGRDNDESIDVYDARVNGGLPLQSPPPSQECIRDDCKATPGAGPELPFGGSEALTGPQNVKPRAHKRCGKGKRATEVKKKVRCVKKHKAKKQQSNKTKKGGNR
jgi:hypothetical protein